MLYVYINGNWEKAAGELDENLLDINTLGGTPLSIVNGGTGSTTAGAALTALGVQSYVQTAGQNSQGNKTVSTSTPTGGSDGDIWYQYE